jgi:hypothetical protein
MNSAISAIRLGIPNRHVIDHRYLFVRRPFTLLELGVSHPKIRKCEHKSRILMEQKADVVAGETGRFDSPYPGIRGRDHADVLTDHVAPTKRPLLPPLQIVREVPLKQFCPFLLQGVVFEVAARSTKGQ